MGGQGLFGQGLGVKVWGSGSRAQEVRVSGLRVRARGPGRNIRSRGQWVRVRRPWGQGQGRVSGRGRLGVLAVQGVKPVIAVC